MKLNFTPLAALRAVSAQSANAGWGRNMKKLLLTTALVTLASAAHADLFTNGANFTVSLGNSPTTENDTVTFSPGVTQVLAGGALNLTISVVNAGGGAQWVVFDYQTTSASTPLSLGNQGWSLAPVGLPAAVALNFIGDYTQWQGPDGANIAQTGRIFNQTLMSSPITGVVGSGEGTLGFVNPIGGPGPLTSLGGFANPFQIVLNGLPATQVNGEIAALEFAPQVAAVPEPSTWAMMILGFLGIGTMAYRRRKGAMLAA
jgi:hypothetical protein